MEKKKKVFFKQEKSSPEKKPFLSSSLLMQVKIVCFALGILVAAYFCFYDLGKPVLDNWDEGFHATMAKEMMETGNYIIPHWNKHIFIDKPPLYMWLSIGWTKIFGVNEFSMRFTSAISGFIVLVGVTWFIYRHYGFLPALFTYLSLLANNLFVARTRSGNFDAFTAFLTFSAFLLILSKKNYRYPFLGLVFAALYLTRGSFVLMPGIIFALHELFFRWRQIPKNIVWYLVTLIVFVLPCAAWLYAGSLQNVPDFLNFFLYNSDHNVSATAISNFTWEYVQYGYYAMQRRYFFVFLLGLVFLLWNIKKPLPFLLFCFSLFLIVLLSFSAKKNNWYLVPTFPFWSMVVGYGIYQGLRLVRYNKVVIILLLVAGSYISYRAYIDNLIPLMNTSSASGEAASAKYIKARSKPTDTIARLDYLYSSFIYYSDSKVRISPSGSKLNDQDAMGTSELVAAVKKKKIKWLAGETRDVNYFSNLIPDVPHRKIEINPAEYVIEIL